MGNSIKERIIEQLKRLPADQQERVLEYIRTLADIDQAGVPGTELLRFAGAIDRDDQQLMSNAVEEGCERVDRGGW